MKKILILASLFLTIFLTFQVTHFIIKDGILNYEIVNDNLYVSSTNINSYGEYFGKIIKEIDIPSEVKYENNTYKVSGIKSETFLKHYKVEKITIPDTVEYIEDSAFSICTNLKSVNIPKGVTIIKESTFAGCSELSNVILHDNVEVIEGGAFSLCKNIKTLYLPKSIKFIDEKSFLMSGCNFIVEGDSIPEGWQDGWNASGEVTFSA